MAPTPWGPIGAYKGVSGFVVTPETALAGMPGLYPNFPPLPLF